jgi:hypothetical protein
MISNINGYGRKYLLHNSRFVFKWHRDMVCDNHVYGYVISMFVVLSSDVVHRGFGLGILQQIAKSLAYLHFLSYLCTSNDKLGQTIKKNTQP